MYAETEFTLILCMYGNFFPLTDGHSHLVWD